jgi:integrase
MKRARALRLIARNPLEDVKRPTVERHEAEVLEPEESGVLLRAAKGTYLHTPVFIALATGLRRGEILALRWQDIDLDRQTLTVNQSLEQTRDGLRFKAPKTKQSRRTIALSPSAVGVLQAHRVLQLEERIKLGLGRDGISLVFARHDGQPINPRNFSKEFSRLRKRAGVRPVTFHGLRHTHFTTLLREGIHPKIASERAGHASVAITMDIYSHAIPSLQEDAALRIDAALRTILEH